MDKEPQGTPLEPEKQPVPASPFPKTEETPVSESTPVPTEPLPPQEKESDEGDDLLVHEDEEDFFFLLQNIFWGAMKSLFIVFILLAILWIIWKKEPGPEKPPSVEPISVETNIPEDNTPQKNEEVTTEKETKTPWWKKIFSKDESKENDNEPQTNTEKTLNTDNEVITPEPVQPIPTTNKPSQVFISTENAASEAAKWHIYLEKQRLFELENNLSDASSWIKKAQSLYTVGFAQQIQGSTPVQREISITALLEHLNNLLAESFAIRTELYRANLEFIQKEEQANLTMEAIQERINSLLQTNNTETVPQLTEQKGEQAKIHTLNQTRKQTYEFYLLYIEQYDKSLRQVYEVIFANQEAIAHNIRVVNFPTDPFQSVLTPTQWREGAAQ